MFRPSLGARGGDPGRTTPRGGFCHMFLSLGSFPSGGLLPCFHLETGKRGIQKIMKYLKNSAKSRKK